MITVCNQFGDLKTGNHLDFGRPSLSDRVIFYQSKKEVRRQRSAVVLIP